MSSSPVPVKHSESLARIGAALSKAQASLKVAVKGSTNPHLKTRYADLSSVWASCRAALAENDLSVVQLPVSDDPGYVALETMLLHSSGEFISARCRVRLPKDDPQGAGSGLTYLRRYALSAALGIVADEDDDAEAASQPLLGQSTVSPPSPPARPLSAEAAQRLHAQLETLLSGTPHARLSSTEYAAQSVGRIIEALTDLTTREAGEVYAAARAAQREAQAA
ncbi:ERF family protein [Deinococcus alpinitundrae]|uniref:ERF family protein n=1 Tax=Deinococcus alpinitundrae TaxID=468913 RepID=UPI001379B0E3|nr:ERF family protein [Deinococcus alpinitundrae]